MLFSVSTPLPLRWSLPLRRRAAADHASPRRLQAAVAGRLEAIYRTARHRELPHGPLGPATADAASSAVQAHLLRTRWLSIAATLSPLVGLLGTVLGMVEAFDAISQSAELGDPRIVAAGLSKALVTTGAGLAVGISALSARHFFVARIERAAAAPESALGDFLQAALLAAPAASPGEAEREDAR